LNIITVAYAGQAVTPPPMNGVGDKRRDHLFGSYVNQMLRRRAVEHRYKPEQTVHWLSWLASQMANHGQTIFYLERLQIDWFPKRLRWAILVCYGLVETMVFGLSAALLGGLFGGPFNGSLIWL